MQSLAKISIVLLVVALLSGGGPAALAQSCADRAPSGEKIYFTAKITKISESDRGKNVTTVGHGWKITFLAKQTDQYTMHQRVNVMLVRNPEGIWQECKGDLTHDDHDWKQTSILLIDDKEVDPVMAEDLHKKPHSAYRPPVKPRKHIVKKAILFL